MQFPTSAKLPMPALGILVKFIQRLRASLNSGPKNVKKIIQFYYLKKAKMKNLTIKGKKFQKHLILLALKLHNLVYFLVHCKLS